MTLQPISYGMPKPTWEVGKMATCLLGLPNVHSEVNRLKFPDGVLLRKAEPWELTFSGEKPGVLSSLYGFASSAEYLLELTLTARELVDTELLASIWLGGAITALRLLKPNLVRVGQVYLYQPDVPGSRRSEWWSYDDDHAQLNTDEYLLTKKDTYTLRKIYIGMSKLRVNSYAPFQRFSSARSRTRPSDRLIDYWIGLESLFSKEGESQELSYKYAIRIAHYVGKDQTSRLDFFSSMTKAYGARSKVVHGKKVKGLQEAERAAERALRESLRRAAMEQCLPNQDDLDKRAASGSK
jgi:hypothetical protein